MKQRAIRVRLAVLALAGFASSLHAGTITFKLLSDPGQNYTFSRTDSPSGASVSDPVGPYPGMLSTDPYGFFCIDYVKTATWSGAYSGNAYGVADAVPNKTTAQLVEAAFLADKLYWLGGSGASTALYQGPISFAVWQIMDPTPGDVPVNSAAQPFILEAQNAYLSGAISAANFPNIKIFVPDNPSIQDFMTVTAGAPEPGTIALFAGGLLLIGLGRLRRSRR